MTYIVSSGALNSTHSLTAELSINHTHIRACYWQVFRQLKLSYSIIILQLGIEYSMSDLISDAMLEAQ